MILSLKKRDALRDAQGHGNDVRGATAYVTLEPFNHFGRTPPCSDALVRAGLGRVVSAMVDPKVGQQQDAGPIITKCIAADVEQLWPPALGRSGGEALQEDAD